MKRYQNKRIIVNAYLSKLFSIKNITTESANLIKNILDITSDCLNGCKSLNIPTDSWDSIIIFMTRHRINKTMGRKVEKPRWTTIAWRTYWFSGGNNTTTKKAFHTSKEHCILQWRPLSLQMQRLKFTTQHQIKGCNEEGIMLHCLIPKHRVTECRQRTNCKICKRWHHSLLHLEQDGK